MVPQLPEDILQEITAHINSDVRTLCSCALTSRAWARHCRPWIFRKVNLKSYSDKPRYIKLREVLKKNPTFADHTRELHLFPGGFEGTEDELEGYAQFLSCFKRLEKATFNEGWGLGGDAQPKAFARVFELESLMSLTLRERLHFPRSLQVDTTDLQPHPADMELPQPEQSTSTTPTFQVQNDYSPVLNRVPLSLSLYEVQPETIQACARLVRGQRGFFKSHWIEKLRLGLPLDDDDDEPGPACRACCELLQAMEPTQQGLNGAESLSHFTLRVGISHFPYGSLGSVLPPNITAVVLHLNAVSSYAQPWDPDYGGRLLEEFIRNLAGPGRPALREMELRPVINLRPLQKLTNIPNPLLEVDRLLSALNLFPSFQEFRFAAIILLWEDRFKREDPELERLREDFEKEVGRWFPSLKETGRVVVEWNMFSDYRELPRVDT